MALFVEHLGNFMRVKLNNAFRLTLVLIALIVIIPFHHAFSQAQNKNKINPTPDETAPFKVYIPIDLEDSYRELKKMLSPEMLKEIKDTPENTMGGEYHMGLGMWMRNNWGLWAGSRLAKHFNQIGIFHPDDMSSIIIKGFWHNLNEKKFDLQARVTEFQLYWKVNAEPKAKNCPLDKSLIEVNESLDKSEKNQPRTLHIGRCKKHKHLWIYEHDKGWYRPDAKLRKEIEED